MTSLEFKQLVLPLKNKMYRFAMSFLKIQADAEDVVQDVMIKCWETIRDPKEIKSIEAFGMTLVRNKSLDKLKKKGRNYTEVSEQYDLASASASPLDETVISDSVQRIRSLISNLPEAQRSVIVLRDMEGFTYDEISQVLGIKVNQVKVYLHRARKQVRTQMIKTESYGVQ